MNIQENHEISEDKANVVQYPFSAVWIAPYIFAY